MRKRLAVVLLLTSVLAIAAPALASTKGNDNHGGDARVDEAVARRPSPGREPDVPFSTGCISDACRRAQFRHEEAAARTRTPTD